MDHLKRSFLFKTGILALYDAMDWLLWRANSIVRIARLTIGVKIHGRKTGLIPSMCFKLVIKPIQDGLLQNQLPNFWVKCFFPCKNHLLISWGLGVCGVKSLGLGCKTATFRENYTKSFSFLASWSIPARILWESENPQTPSPHKKSYQRRGAWFLLFWPSRRKSCGELISHLVEHSPAMRSSAAGSKQKVSPEPFRFC